MNFSKVKLIIIACLLAVNVLLGVICVRLYYDKSYISEEEALYAGAHLEKNGVYAEFDTEQRKKYNLPVYSAETDNGRVIEIYQSITESFFERRIASADYVTTPEGQSVSVKTAGGEPLGTSLLTDNMKVECVKEQKLAGADRKELAKGVHYFYDELSENKKQEKLADEFLKNTLGAYGLDYKLCGSAEYEGGCIAFFTLKLSDTEVSDLYMNIYIKDGEIVYCTGNIISSAPVKAYSINLIDAVDAMYLLSRNSDVQEILATGNSIDVTLLKMTYKILEYEQNRYYIIPAWLIDYRSSDGTEKSIVFDAVVGESEYIPF